MLASCASTPTIDVAKKLYEDSKYDDAFHMFESLAQQGNAEAQDYLGRMHETGKGVEKNLNTARQWYVKSSENGYSEAAFHVCWVDAIVDKPVKFDLDCVLRAAEAGSPQAMYAASARYLYGDDVPFDLEKGLNYLRESAKKGNGEAQLELGQLYCEGRFVKRDAAEAHKWFEKAYKEGGAQFGYGLAFAYEFGIGVHADHNMAAKLYFGSAAQGDPRANFYTALFIEKGLIDSGLISPLPHYERAIAAFPYGTPPPFYLLNYAAALMKLDQRAKAKGLLSDFLARYRKDIDGDRSGLMIESLAKFFLGRLPAEELVRRADSLAHEPKDPYDMNIAWKSVSHFFIGRYQFANGNVAGAVVYFENTVALQREGSWEYENAKAILTRIGKGSRPDTTELSLLDAATPYF